MGGDEGDKGEGEGEEDKRGEREDECDEEEEDRRLRMEDGEAQEVANELEESEDQRDGENGEEQQWTPNRATQVGDADMLPLVDSVQEDDPPTHFDGADSTADYRAAEVDKRQTPIGENDGRRTSLARQAAALGEPFSAHHLSRPHSFQSSAIEDLLGRWILDPAALPTTSHKQLAVDSLSPLARTSPPSSTEDRLGPALCALKYHDNVMAEQGRNINRLHQLAMNQGRTIDTQGCVIERLEERVSVIVNNDLVELSRRIQQGHGRSERAEELLRNNIERHDAQLEEEASLRKDINRHTDQSTVLNVYTVFTWSFFAAISHGP
ncbi:hypothetical protein CONPUDRAFT_147899 [Coniophora puteana RWD-64-598 SS2]|uniref:Uncharacterized protein n=1 Tax=Coniophora puteana (strain RWD-64-598) TaxID=741705 RepID=R7SE32_CONPW|nr:uncharacterized protein CONPUDRAFT_147899 [Coniophora puteana RWD-64-598 SS2]EIW74120.1 hypothetical protein CONPUDRAFT_147899 [Coniophora puteana RWD-64-598 SS2]